MPSILTLPLEIRGCISLALENASDLLHLALTCKLFYELIIPTHHLRLVNISCSTYDSETPSEFWEKLTRHLCSMIRHLEICGMGVFVNLSYRRFFPGQRIDKDFVSAWTGSSSSSQLPITPASTSRGLIRSLSIMDGLISISLFHERKYDEYLRHMSRRFSQSLKVLHVSCTSTKHPDGHVPRYEPSDYSFHHLTTFSLKFWFDRIVPEPLYLLLDNLVSSCHTLMEFGLAVRSYRKRVFLPLRWMQKAHWPSLKKLTLIGPVRFGDADDTIPREEIVDSVISFFARHSKLECLYLDRLDDDVGNEDDTVDNVDDDLDRFLTQPNERFRDILPCIRSLESPFPVPPDILPRLVHVANLDYTQPEFYHLAKSLRSCNLSITTVETLRPIVEHIPQLERFATIVVVPDDYRETCFWDGVPALITRLENLTHLELYVDNVESEDMCTTADFAECLPSLTYSCVWGEHYQSDWMRISVDPDDPEACEFEWWADNPDQSFRSENWGDFFMLPTMREF